MDNMRTSIVRFVAALGILTLAACETPITKYGFPEQTYRHLPQISLDVAEIEIVHLFQLPLKAPHIEHEVPAPLHEAIERWILARLHATGRTGKAVVEIRDASIVENQIKPLGGIKGALTTEQGERYDARIETQINAWHDKHRMMSKASAINRRSQTILEDATLRERKMVWYELTEKLMRDFDKNFEAQIRQHLKNFIK